MTYHPSQGRISKRYNRRVRYAHVTRRLKLRIAELEAELAETKDKLETANQQILIDAKLREKAEAEVERLTGYLSNIAGVVRTCGLDEQDADWIQDLAKGGIWGGGRESGGEGVGDPASQVAAAANPAARKERASSD